MSAVNTQEHWEEDAPARFLSELEEHDWRNRFVWARQTLWSLMCELFFAVTSVIPDTNASRSTSAHVRSESGQLNKGGFYSAAGGEIENKDSIFQQGSVLSYLEMCGRGGGHSNESCFKNASKRMNREHVVVTRKIIFPHILHFGSSVELKIWNPP